jgi:excisionase family DNA binding protein
MDTERQNATMTVDEAHAEIGIQNISRAALYNAIGRSEFPHIRLGRRILIPKYAFQQWLKSAGLRNDNGRPAA